MYFQNTNTTFAATAAYPSAPILKSILYVPGALAGRVTITLEALYEVIVVAFPLTLIASALEAAPPKPLPLIVIDSPPKL